MLINSADMALNLFSRMKGLLGTDTLAAGEALYIRPCGSVHTFFMRFALDIIFLDKNLRVVSIYRDVKPFRMRWGGAGAASVLELASGWFDYKLLSIGDEIAFSR